MNPDVTILFFNAIFSVVLAAAVVIRILRREYLPEIERLEALEPELSDRDQRAVSTSPAVE